MLSDDSSSDSETGRFKCSSEKTKEMSKSSKEKDLDKQRNRSTSHRYQIRNDMHRDRHRERNRYSPTKNRKHSREKSSNRRRYYSRERSSNRKSRERTPNRHRTLDNNGRRSSGKNERHSKSRNFKSPDSIKVSSKMSIATKEKRLILSHISSDNESKESIPNRTKRSEIHVPTPQETQRKVTQDPDLNLIETDEHDSSIQPQSYYNMIPMALKEKTTESSEIDSSDDEKLREKLLSLKQKVKKRKHKKKYKKKSSKQKEKDDLTVEVSSTTDIKENITVENIANNDTVENTEVTSTQKSVQKESSEEGEISDDSSSVTYDPSDLRHKLTRSISKRQPTIPEPQIDPKLKLEVCGPALPPHLQKKFRKSKTPEVVPEFKKVPDQLEKEKILGPIISPNIRQMLARSKPSEEAVEISDEDGDIGPLPKGSEDKWSIAHQRLEERALDLKIKQLDGRKISQPDIKAREEWMLELPEAKAKYLGLEARTFRAKEGPDMSDRSCWTDTPKEKEKIIEGQLSEKDIKKNFETDVKVYQIALHDDEQEKEIRKHKKKHKRDESLYEIHQKKLKKKKKKEDKMEKKERKPFNRETDLQVNRFDEAQKRSIINKAQDLNSRFSRGEAKYL